MTLFRHAANVKFINGEMLAIGTFEYCEGVAKKIMGDA